MTNDGASGALWRRQGVISGALVLLKSPEAFNLTALESESVVSAAVLGAIVGAALSSCGNHVFGRKPVILLSSLLFTLGSVLMGVATTFPALLAGRLAVGVGIGFSSMTVPLYIAEVSPPHVRGRLVSLNTLLVTGGQFFACVLDAMLSRVPDGWRYMLGLAAVPAAVQLLGFLLLPESPRYLLSRGTAHSKEAAWAALVRIRGTADVETEFSHIENEVKRSKGADTLNVWREIRSPSVVRALTLGCFLQALQQLCGINTVMYYGATIIQMAGFSDPATAIWLSAVVSFSNFLFTFVGIYLVDRAGRRILTLASLAGVVLSLLALGASFYAAEALSTPVATVGEGACGAAVSCFDCVANAACGFCALGANGDGAAVRNTCVLGDALSPLGSSQGFVCAKGQWAYASCPRDSSGPGWLILATLFIYLACFASGMGCMPWTINAEIYPLRVRSFALSLATSVNWVSNLLVSFTFLSVIDALAPHGAFWLYALLAALGFVFLWRELPETKGLALEEIQRIFERRLQYEKIDRE